MKIAIALEDYRHDQYIIKSIIDKMATKLRIRINYRVIMDPMIGGISQLKDPQTISSICIKYAPMTDLIIFIHDRDGDARRDGICGSITRSAGAFAHKVLCVAAHQEIETWGLAGMTDLPTDWSWNSIRAEGSVKEIYFEPYVNEAGLSSTAGKGREGVARKIIYKRAVELCPDLKELELSITQHWEQRVNNNQH